MELHSNLLSSLFTEADEDRYLTVFDAGSARPETVEFFAQYRCRLYVADLYTEDVVVHQHDEAIAADLYGRFSQLFSYPACTQFDICLLWDLPNYLDKPALQAFSKALYPFLSPSTRIHGFGTLKSSTKLPHQQFAIQQADCLSVHPREGSQLPCYPHPQAELKRLLYGIDVSKATLLSNGLLEMLLEVTDPHPAPR